MVEILITKIKEGCTYIFYQKDENPQLSNDRMINAYLFKINYTNNTLELILFSKGNCIWTIPIEWIEKIEISKNIINITNTSSLIKINNLIEGKRYYISLEINNNNTLLRANFFKVVHFTTIQLKKCEKNNHLDNSISCFPILWIKEIKTLSDFLNNKSKYPNDLLNEIDNFI